MPLLSACNLRGLETNSFVHLIDIYQAPIMCQASAKVLGRPQRRSIQTLREAKRLEAPGQHHPTQTSWTQGASLSACPPGPPKYPDLCNVLSWKAASYPPATGQRPHPSIATSTLSSVPRFPSYIPPGTLPFPWPPSQPLTASRPLSPSPWPCSPAPQPGGCPQGPPPSMSTPHNTSVAPYGIWKQRLLSFLLLILMIPSRM